MCEDGRSSSSSHNNTREVTNRSGSREDGRMHLWDRTLKMELNGKWLEARIVLASALDLTRLPPRGSTLGGRWPRKPFGLSRVQPIYLSIPRLLRYKSILFLNIIYY